MFTFFPDDEDTDGDGLIDAVDPDDDNDGILDDKDPDDDNDGILDVDDKNQVNKVKKPSFKIKNLDQCGDSSTVDERKCYKYCREDGTGKYCSKITPRHKLNRKCCECNFCDRKVPPKKPERYDEGMNIW